MKKPGTDERKKIGQLGEQIAKEHLLLHDYRIVQLNWRCRSGEIDIIAHADDTIVFIEVRTRKNNNRFGLASESVDDRKQKKVRATAQVYLHLNNKHDRMIRFDVIAVLLNEKEEVITVDHICNAF
jgi:putative endonuclease